MPETLLLAQLLTPYQQALLSNSVEAANIDILAADLIPTQTVKRLAREAATGIVTGEVTAPCLFRIQVCSDTAATFSARIKRAGEVTQPFIFNDDTDLTVDAGYMFDLLVHDGDTINFRFSANVTVRNLRVQEIRGGTE